ncbi:hypothetical protein ZIOFF_007932 [Zingiber officinale]|uniref:Uncharacterized protein n=1 Tax=Zingiber officinale TaxID=94328 RepID=A0A8J5I5P8_ZINOF|nr:hypothetical protein ZIOFF_007932 [Zingiber officinale]
MEESMAWNWSNPIDEETSSEVVMPPISTTIEPSEDESEPQQPRMRNDYRLVGYSDSDWCGDVDDRKSTSGYVFLLGNTAFTWMSKKQPIVTLSTCEAEYVAASWSVCHAVWLSNLLRHLRVIRDEGTVIRVDNKSAIELAKNPVNHGRSKHIDVRFHFIREQVKEGKIELEHVESRTQAELEHVESRTQAADVFTKPLPTTLLENCKRLIGMRDGKSI